MSVDASVVPVRLCLGDLLTRAAAQFAGRPALHSDGRTWTYAELSHCVEVTLVDLKRLGLRPGERVVVIGTNRVQEVALLFALNELGCGPLLVNARVAPAQLDALIDHCEPKLTLFVGAQSDTVAHAARRGAMPHSFTALDDVRVECQSSASPPEVRAARRENDVAAMICTSGTSGTPKIAMLSHRNLVFLALTQQRRRRYTEHDKTFCALPLAHVGALSILLCVVAAGACLYLEPRFVPAHLARAIREEGISVVPGLPPLHRKFVEWVAENPREFERGRVRLITTSSSPLSKALKQAIEELYGCPLQNSYGSTESGLVFQTEVDRWRDDTSVGSPLPGVSVRIADADGRDLPRGERGEIQVRGPNVFLGYYRSPAATRAAFTADGWLRSGDLGYLDSSSCAFITGRAKETIRRSGYTLYPAEIEAELNEHPDVALSAVVAAPRAADEEVVAFVELKVQATVDTFGLLDFLAARLAPYELPGHIRLGSLPTLTNGKIDRLLLRHLAAEIAS